MPRIVYQSMAYECREGETVLDAFLRQGVELPFSCRNGVCQVCLRRCVSGTLPEAAQAGLRPALRALGYFLPCKCVPQTDMEIAPPREADLYSPAVVHSKELLAPDVCRLLLEPATALYYRAGQFINLRRPDGLARSYSLASLPQEDYFLELHVKRMRGGLMSNWIFEELVAGDEVEIQGPLGRCYYVPGAPTQSLLLIATGTGLAPLVGIVRDALRSAHRGDIFLYHGARTLQELYWCERLRELCGRHPNLHFTACVSGSEVPPGAVHGRATDIAFARHPDLRGWRVYLAGSPSMVQAGEEFALRAGAHPERVHADPFLYKERRRRSRDKPTAGAAPRPGERTLPAPDPEMWAALREGERLIEILTDFYDRVFEDAQLAPYFRGVTKRRLIEKVYSFMRHLFTGEKIYFGDWPRNAHHWMVISDELFDHREQLMEACLRRHGLPEHLIRRWRALEESFRPDVVKAEPWVRVMAGVELPLDGYGETTVEVGTLCDSCAREIAPGEAVRYHLRLGTTYCADCAGLSNPAGAPGMPA